MNRVNIISAMVLVTFALTAQTAYAQHISYVLTANTTAATDKLMPDPDHTWRWNSGFSYGFLRTHLSDLNHTKEFWDGYRNGSVFILANEGYVEGCSHIVNHGYKSHVPSYKGGYAEGAKYADDSYSACKLPSQTDDGYHLYYVGFHDGGIAEGTVSGGDFTRGETFSEGSGCPAGKGGEYCAGYHAGWQSEYNMEAE
jgi:hypothetical protein